MYLLPNGDNLFGKVDKLSIEYRVKVMVDQLDEHLVYLFYHLHAFDGKVTFGNRPWVAFCTFLESKLYQRIYTIVAG